MIQLACLCGATSTQPVGQKHDRTVVQCTQCLLYRTLEVPANYAQQYADGSYHESVGETRADQERYVVRARHDTAVGASRVGKLLARTRLLDVGCANGGFLKAARQAGFDAEGLELNPELATWAEAYAGVPVHLGWGTVTPWFDVITYHDVIEHVPDPGAELERAWQYLKPGGRLILDTPDAGHETFQQDPMASHHMKPQEHLWFFDELTLGHLLRLHRFRVEHVDRPIPGKLVLYARSY